ncbi:MAG: hypothetical protein IJV44_01420 [Prevotella sp.]|nr:hypothetical protein [Prevotella sp.]
MNDIAKELAKLHVLTGADFSRQVEKIACMHVFQLIRDENNIYSAIGEKEKDYKNLIIGARKLVNHGYRVFILPNPKNVRTPDFIVERRGVYRIYDLKTISGETSVINRLQESIGQCNQVILNMSSVYNARQLGKDIRQYFEKNPNGVEIMILKGNQQIIVKRKYALKTDFVKTFMMRYYK